MYASSLLLAVGLHDLIMVVVGAGILLSWVLRRLREEQQKARAQQAGRPQAVPPRQGQQQPPQAAQAVGGQQADPLRTQIEDFLKRASQAAGPPQATGPKPMVGQSAPAGRKTIELLPIDEPAASRPKRSPPPPPRPPKPRPPQRVPSQRTTSVAEHVAQNVVAATDQLGQEASQLGDRVKQADEQFDVQLHQKFDHEIGSLGAKHAERVQEQATTTAVSPATQIAAMLANPDGVRQAMVLNEILRRPEDRW